jgi:hypothetical protein
VKTPLTPGTMEADTAGSEQMLANLKDLEKMAEDLKESIDYFRTD